MTTAASTITAAHAGDQAVRFDWLLAASCTWLVGGLFIDGWAHFHLASSTESFFTPWHALLYSGVLACAGLLVSAILTSPHRAQPLWRRVPAGYEASVIGLAVFGVGGACDMLWHVLVGVEKDIATQLSPSHLFLATGFVLIVSGPFRAAANRIALRRTTVTLKSQFPAIFSLGLVLAILTPFTKALQPTFMPLESRDWQLNSPYLVGPLLPDVRYLQEALGIACFVVQSIIIMACLLTAFRRNLLPPGSVTLILATATALFEVSFLPVSLAGGLVADYFLYRWRRLARPYFLRIFAFGLPALLCAFFHIEIAVMRGGIWWPAHLVAGSIVLSGLAGFGMSFLMLPEIEHRPVAFADQL